MKGKPDSWLPFLLSLPAGIASDSSNLVIITAIHIG